jgi:DNA-binding Lrp family transcriptional regulator
MGSLDRVDLELLSALADDHRATVVALADRLGLSRNTVQARMLRLERSGVFHSYERAMSTQALGLPIEAMVSVMVRQADLPRITTAIAEIPEVVQAHGMSGQVDLLVRVVARDTQHLFDVDARILAIEGVERTETSLVMGEVIGYRVRPLLEASSRSRCCGNRLDGNRSRAIEFGVRAVAGIHSHEHDAHEEHGAADDLDRPGPLPRSSHANPRAKRTSLADEGGEARSDARNGHDAERVAEGRPHRAHPEDRKDAGDLDAAERDRHSGAANGSAPVAASRA